MATKRAAIVEQVKSRFSGIRITNGYRTDIGTHVYEWKTTPFYEEELPGINIRDFQEVQTQQVSNRHHRELQMEVDIALSGTLADEQIREAIGDIESAIGVDRRWGTLAFNTDLVDNQMDVVQDDIILGVGRVRFNITYRTESLNPDL